MAVERRVWETAVSALTLLCDHTYLDPAADRPLACWSLPLPLLTTRDLAVTSRSDQRARDLPRRWAKPSMEQAPGGRCRAYVVRAVVAVVGVGMSDVGGSGWSGDEQQSPVVAACRTPSHRP